MKPRNKGVAHGIDGWRLDVAYDVGHPFLCVYAVIGHDAFSISFPYNTR